MNLHDLFSIPLRRSPGKTALRFEGRSLTYAELFGAADRLAAGLRDRGLRPGDRVAFFLGNLGKGPEFVIAYLAVIRLGAVMVPLNLAYRRREIAHILADAEPRLFLTDRDRLPVLEELEPDERPGEVILAEDLDGLSGDPGGFARIDNDDLAMILYTSGTTGRSKGAMITHGNVLATMTGLLAAWAWEAEDVLLLTLPLFHTHGLVVGLHCALAAGATVLLHRKFDASETAAGLLGGEPTLFFGVPTMYVRLVEELRRRGDAEALRRMRLFCSGSAPLAPETFEAFRELTGHEILERYGMTETGMSLSNAYAGLRIPGTVGTPLPGVSARIVDAEGIGCQDLPAGGEGELLVRGSHVFPGYWRDPGKTAASFVHDDLGRRWFRTGDLARRDPETGHYTLLGRRHELILRGGFNIYPREVEEVLTSYPGVREAAVVGRPDSDLGQIPVAFLVVESPESPLNEAALLAFCRDQMAAFKVPREVRIVESLPRNALGKVQKHLL
ncbi:MAG TPA: acyl-CoA synthetase [Thermoanaerobaculia bacterium]|jgi:malonyl-CoA/methylmalonyl-CoA synthetase|nr:acyl-CoA synthetase [Thermoanaerobaculia bacterium]